MRKVTAAAAAAIVATLAAACGSDGGSGGSSASAGDTGEQTVIKWASQPGNPTNLPLLVAQDVGVTEANGIEFEVLGVSGGNANQIAAIVSGNADFYIGTLDALAQAVQSGQPVRAFCGYIPRTPLPMMADPDLDLRTFDEVGDFNETIEQFRGLKIGTPARGSSYELKTMSILAEAGISEDDVTFVPVGVGPAVTAALQAGQVDALLGYGFLAAQLQDAGLAETIVDVDQAGPDELRGQQSTVLVGTETWISENGDEASRLCDVVDEANAAIMDPANEDLVKKRLSEDAAVPAGSLQAAYEFASADYYGSDISEEGSAKVLDELTASGILNEPALEVDDVVMRP